jgi:hypothetical protein
MTVPQRIGLFKEIDRMHRDTYGWGMIYVNVWNPAGRIAIDKDARILDKLVPIGEPEATAYYFNDSRGNDITRLRGAFAWQAYEFLHVNPYKFSDYYSPGGVRGMRQLGEDDIVSDNLGRRVKSDVSHPVECLETPIEVQQRKDDEVIWISSTWLYHTDCYSTTSPFTDAIYRAISDAARGDEKILGWLRGRFAESREADRSEFRKALEGYFRGEKLKGRCWTSGYLFAASEGRMIKTFDELLPALAREEKRFPTVLEEFIAWLRSNELNLGEGAEEALRARLRELYATYPCGKAKELCEYLEEEDKINPSDVYLWWGSEPNVDCCYAFLTLFFEVDPGDIGTPRFEERFARNLTAIINIAEKERPSLSFHREYQPHIWNAVFS